MFNQQREIINDLIKYLINGQHEGGVAPNFNVSQKTFNSYFSNNKYRFIRRYEDVVNVPQNQTPVLLVTSPVQYQQGLILFKGHWKDIKSILVQEKINMRAISYFVVPKISNINKHALGSMTYEIKIDYDSLEDKFGFISKDISQIIANHYYKENCGQFYQLTVNDKTLNYVPQSIYEVPPQRSILDRIIHNYNIKFCSIVN